MHWSCLRASCLTRKPTAWIFSVTPPCDRSRATLHGSGGAQLSAPSETSTTVFCLALPRSLAAACSDVPIGVKPRGVIASIDDLSPSRSSGATGETSRESAQPFSRPVPLTRDPNTRRPTLASSGSSSTSVLSADFAAAIFGWPEPSSARIDFDASTTRITAASLSGAGCVWARTPCGSEQHKEHPQDSRGQTTHPEARVPRMVDDRPVRTGWRGWRWFAVQALAAALTVLVAIGLRLAYGPGHLGYDAVWSLEWGREALAGTTPAFAALGAPTPHPLANAVSLLLAPLGGGAFAVAMALSWLAFAALGVLVFLLGRRLFSAWVGLAAAIVVLTRPLLIQETQQAVLDLPFLALVTGALLAEVARPRGRTLVPVLLALAGLLRPEAWLLGLAWLAYAGRGRPRAQVLRWAALVLAAPLLWAVCDLAVTGDPLWSLHGTQGLAEQLERPRHVGTAVSALPSYLRDALGEPYVWFGLAGAAAGLLGFYERSLLPATLAAAGMLGFLVLGIADLPLLIRYLLVPAVMLCLFCGLLAFGWTAVPRDGPARGAWVAAGVACLALAAAFLPRQADAIDGGPRLRADRRGDPGRSASNPRRARALPHALRARRPAASAARLLARALTGQHPARSPTGGRAPRRAPPCSSTRTPRAPGRSPSRARRRRPGALRSRPAGASWRRTPRGWSFRAASA